VQAKLLIDISHVCSLMTTFIFQYLASALFASKQYVQIYRFFFIMFPPYIWEESKNN